MKNMEKAVFAEQLIDWYRRQKRDLPWRYTYNPYHIWISEIMLQQTQMERGISYFNHWIERFPDVEAVAEAEEQEILRYWQGLGYYARARNIHRAAKEILFHFEGIVPADYEKLLTLPGIGSYTAAAIASIAGNHDIAVVDANVCRVYARLFDIADNIKNGEGFAQVRQLAGEILPKGRARHFNQAIMDFGGLLCTPRSPECEECFVRSNCLAFLHGVVEERPVLPPKKEKILQRRLAGLIVCDGRFLLRQRGQKELWAGLWDLPGVLLYSQRAKGVIEPASPELPEVSALLSTATGRNVQAKKFLVSVRHQFTHHNRTVDCWLCETADTVLNGNERWVDWRDIGEYGLPAGARKILSLLEKREIKEAFDSLL